MDKNFVPLEKINEPTNEHNILEKDKLEISKLNLELKLAEASIKSVDEIIAIRQQLQSEEQTLAEERAMVTAERALLNGLENDYKSLLNSMNDIIKHQEKVTNEANTKLALAESKSLHYEELQTKKCTDCLRRDKNKCDKCNYKLYSEKYKKDFDKWVIKSSGKIH